MCVLSEAHLHLVVPQREQIFAQCPLAPLISSVNLPIDQACACAGTPSASFSTKSPPKGAGFKSVASALIQSQARRNGDDAAAAADSRAASQSRLFAGTASSEAKRREMLLRAQKEAAAADDGMIRISPEDLAAMRAEIAALRENVQKLQPLDPENAQLKRNLQALQ